MNYKESQRQRQIALIEQGDCFAPAQGGGSYKDTSRKFVLNEGQTKYNLYSSIRECEYFKQNNINWWDGKDFPTGHTLSSQIACLNHLMPIMSDKDAVREIVHNIDNRLTEVLPIENSESESEPDAIYIAFEVVGKRDILNEGRLQRGSNCTSIDALILARDNEGRTLLLPIEWKYTESYNKSDKAANASGRTRQKRYNSLIAESRQLKSLPAYEGSIYYQEPYYQLMRQTLWAERSLEDFGADDFLHLHVVPRQNTLLFNPHGKSSLRDHNKVWSHQLNDPTKYRVIDPAELMQPLTDIDAYKDLMAYLKKRYW